LLSGSLTGCLFRTRRADHVIKDKRNLQQATLNDLVTNIQAQAAKINTLNATVDIAPSVENKKKGEVTDFTEIRGYILMRAPDMLRMIGLFPVVRNRAFDMVSDGKNFKVSLPTQNKFIVGTNNAPEKPSPNTLENLRPQVIFDSLLLHAIHPEETAVLEQSTEMVREEKSKKQVEIPDYIVNVIRREPDGSSILARKIVFSREDLKPHRQLIYDNQGQLATEAIYENFTDYQGTSFPSQITINRPQEGYSIQLSIVKLTLNEPLKDEQFDLQQPPGSKLQVLK
jgi:outer membrane lipoprotein-sorting protein